MILQHSFILSNFTRLGSFIAVILRTDFGRKTSSSSSQPPLCHGIAVGFTGQCPRLRADVIADMLSIQALSLARIGHAWRSMKLPWENRKIPNAQMIPNDSKWTYNYQLFVKCWWCDGPREIEQATEACIMNHLDLPPSRSCSCQAVEIYCTSSYCTSSSFQFKTLESIATRHPESLFMEGTPMSWQT